MAFFPRVDRQRTLDVVQTLRIGKKIYCENRNSSQVTFTTGSAMSSSVKKDENCNKNKLGPIPNSCHAETFPHHRSIQMPNFSFLPPPGGFASQLALFSGTSLPINRVTDFPSSVFTKALLDGTNKSDLTTKATSVKKFECENCKKKFLDATALQAHIRRFHVGARSFPCPECGKTFNAQSGLKQHQNIHSSFKPYVCEVCNKAYTQFSNLCRHKRNNVECQTRAKCQKCERLFRSSSETNNICKSCRKSASAKASSKQSKTKDDKKSSQNKPINQNAPKTDEVRCDLVLGNSPFPQLEELCSSVSKPSSPLSSSVKLSLPPRKRLWDAAFLSHSTESSQNSESISCVEEQCPSNRSSFGSDSELKRASNGETPETCSNFNNATKCPVNAKKDFSGQNSSLSPFKLLSNLSALPSKKQFLQRSHPHAAAAAVAAEYLYCSSVEKKPKSISIANNQINRFKSALAQVSSRKTATKAEKRKETSASPLDLSVKKRKRCNSDTRLSPTDREKSSDWKRYLDLIFKAGQHYGSFLPSTYQHAASLYNHASNLISPLRKEHSWKNPPAGMYLPYAASFPQLPHSSSTTLSPTSSKQISSSAPNYDLQVRKEGENISRTPPQSVSQCGSRYSCRFCYREFPKIANLSRHERTHTGEQPYECPHCSKSFSISSNMQRHIKNLHNKEKLFPCFICGKFFDQQSDLDQHLQSHLNQASPELWTQLTSSPITNGRINGCQTTPYSNSSILKSAESNPALERRLSSTSSHESSDSTPPFRPWNHGEEKELSLSPSSERSVGPPEKTADFYYPEISHTNALELMTNRVMNGLNPFKGTGAVQA